MPPTLALVLTLLLIAYLFRYGFEPDYKPSVGLWIPTIWFLILMSRSVTAWLNLHQAGTVLEASSESMMEGSPIDRFIMSMLIFCGVVVLWRRHLPWPELFRKNGALTVFFLYCGVSILWSDFPFVAFKRWTKALGDPIMVLVILTDPSGLRAVETVIKRCAFVLLPLSVLFIKYYPEYGKVYDEWTGYGMYTGVTMNKNLLGFDLMVVGLFFSWRLLIELGARRNNLTRAGVIIPIGILLMNTWLFSMANSQTSFLSYLLALAVVFLVGFECVRRRLGLYLLVGLTTFLTLDVTVDVTRVVVESAGRNMTLTGRTEIWESVLKKVPEPIVGAGFESFWLGDRLEQMWAEFFFKPNQAHNGYIEVYLNLGALGLFLLAAVIASSYRRLREMLNSSVTMAESINYGRLGLGFLFAYLAYNYTEAAFKSLHFMFLIFLLFTIRPPRTFRQVMPSGMYASPGTCCDGNLPSP